MSVIVALFIGLTVSAEEIIKDRKILKRETFLNLSRASYLLSKVAILFTLSAIQAFFFVILGNWIMEIKGMYFEYWLVLFSAWSFANLLGLNISDSFKTAVTIYILIPFLVIPQLILSGVLVKFDKLNPNISSPESIPWYGEIITARWAYEALAVYTFKENEYEKQFYPYDKIMSISNYKKDYLLRTLSNKINSCKRNLKNPDKKEQVINDLTLLRNEIKKELKSNKKVGFDNLDSLYYDILTPSVINSVKDYFDVLVKYYRKRYNKANKEKDKIINDLQKTEEEKQKFILMKKYYHNENLKELVKNETELERIVEYKNHLYQKIDPIFQDPTFSFIRAHFYAPRKKLFGSYYSTFWINICVIWFSTITLYIALYYKALKKIIDFFGYISSKFIKKSTIED